MTKSKARYLFWEKGRLPKEWNKNISVEFWVDVSTALLNMRGDFVNFSIPKLIFLHTKLLYFSHKIKKIERSLALPLKTKQK